MSAPAQGSEYRGPKVHYLRFQGCRGAGVQGPRDPRFERLRVEGSRVCVGVEWRSGGVEVVEGYDELRMVRVDRCSSCCAGLCWLRCCLAV